MSKNKDFLGKDPIRKLLVKLSVPAMVGMMVNALYNFVDTIFVGRSGGPEGITAITIAFPVFMLIGAFAQMFGVGAASIVSRKLGEKKENEAADAAGTAIVAGMIVAALILILGEVFIDSVLKMFGASEALLPLGRSYIRWIFVGGFFVTFAMIGNNLARAEGQPKTAMVGMIVGTGLNLVLDPLFIFGFHMGVEGAAVATMLSQACAFLYIMQFYVRGKSHLPLKLSSFRMRLNYLKEMVVLGLSTFVRQSGNSVMSLIVNQSLGFYYGDLGIAAYGVVLRLLMFVMMPIFGIVQGFQPIAGYNFGARLFGRVREVLKESIIFSSILGVAGAFLLLAFPRVWVGIFTSDAALIEFSVFPIRAAALFLGFLGVQAIGATLFQSIGKAIPSLILGLSRQFIFLIPLLLILPRFLGGKGVWLAFPMADLMAVIVTIIWTRKELLSLHLAHKAEGLKDLQATLAE